LNGMGEISDQNQDPLPTSPSTQRQSLDPCNNAP
jgi:hypothetical protein